MVKPAKICKIGAIFSFIALIPTFMTGMWGAFDWYSRYAGEWTFVTEMISPLGFAMVVGPEFGILMHWGPRIIDYVPGILIASSGVLLFVSLKKPKFTIIGSILAVAGPVLWLIVSVFDIGFSSGIYFGAAGYGYLFDYSTYFLHVEIEISETIVWFMGPGFYLPLIGGIMVFISIKGGALVEGKDAAPADAVGAPEAASEPPLLNF
nr:hypothetical protein [Candidatus Sigynarchaeota archaeon]